MVTITLTNHTAHALGYLMAGLLNTSNPNGQWRDCWCEVSTAVKVGERQVTDK